MGSERPRIAVKRLSSAIYSRLKSEYPASPVPLRTEESAKFIGRDATLPKTSRKRSLRRRRRRERKSEIGDHRPCVKVRYKIGATIPKIASRRCATSDKGLGGLYAPSRSLFFVAHRYTRYNDIREFIIRVRAPSVRILGLEPRGRSVYTAVSRPRDSG